ncbi:MAG: hypothetical protein NT009_05110 [Proteobacteria bacterium]|nr:hypothetical protein [Pseudomonadota bacterium]
MNDTSPDIEARFREMMMKKSGQERLRMGFSMFETARSMVIAGIKNKNPNIGDKELKKEIFLHFYEEDFSPEEADKIIKSLA